MAEVLVPIRDRAESAGYEFVDCDPDVVATDGGRCLGEIIIEGRSERASLTLNLYGSETSSTVAPADGTGQSYGVFRSGYSLLDVAAMSSPGEIRESIGDKVDSARESRAIDQGKAAYVVIGNRLWFTSGRLSDPVIDREKFLELISALEGCGPDCHFEETSFER